MCSRCGCCRRFHRVAALLEERDELQAIDDPSAVRLATQIDVAATMLLAAPLHAGVRAVRVADDERQVLLDASRKLEHVPGGSFAKLQHELSASE